MSYVGGADVFDDAADTWTPAAMTAKPSTTRTSETIDFMEVPHLSRLQTRSAFNPVANRKRYVRIVSKKCVRALKCDSEFVCWSFRMHNAHAARLGMNKVRDERASRAIIYSPSDSFPAGIGDAELHYPRELDGARNQERKGVAEARGRRDCLGQQAGCQDADFLHDGAVRHRGPDGSAERRCCDATPSRNREARERQDADAEGVDDLGSDEGHLEGLPLKRSSDESNFSRCRARRLRSLR